MRYKISFVFPMFNESENIDRTLRKATALAAEICDDYEILVVDDASTDGSDGLVSGWAAKDGRVRLIRLGRNTKFGGALKEGLQKASKEIIVYTDADFPAREEDIKKALGLLSDAEIVTAYSLVIKDASLRRILMSKVYNFLVQILFGLNIHDINSGLKIYRRSAISGMKLGSSSPFIDVEIFAEASRRGSRIAQYGLVFELRTKGHSRISRLDVVAKTFWDMLKYRFSR